MNMGRPRIFKREVGTVTITAMLAATPLPASHTTGADRLCCKNSRLSPWSRLESPQQTLSGTPSLPLVVQQNLSSPCLLCLHLWAQGDLPGAATDLATPALLHLGLWGIRLSWGQWQQQQVDSPVPLPNPRLAGKHAVHCLGVWEGLTVLAVRLDW